MFIIFVNSFIICDNYIKINNIIEKNVEENLTRLNKDFAVVKTLINVFKNLINDINSSFLLIVFY